MTQFDGSFIDPIDAMIDYCNPDCRHCGKSEPFCERCEEYQEECQCDELLRNPEDNSQCRCDEFCPTRDGNFDFDGTMAQISGAYKTP